MELTTKNSVKGNTKHNELGLEGGSRHKKSVNLFKEAKQFIPGGVNSPVRAFKSVGGTPIFIKRASGAYLFDEDDTRYIDYVNSWGPMILGHAYPAVVNAIAERAALGTSFGAPTELETRMAALVVAMVPHIDTVRFVSSGTEACMGAIRMARGFTGRNKIIKFRGCYHGHADAFLVAGGSGLSTLGISSSAGVPSGAVSDTLVADYNNIASVGQLFDDNIGKIAAIIVEPVAGNMGCIPPEEGFLQALRNLCDLHGALLIFDEVMTGFRLAAGGAQEYFSVAADIVTFGKIVGGGLPVGAFGARKEIMDVLAPTGNVYQAGTLSGNPLAMAAGIEMLSTLKSDPDVYKRLEEKGQYLQTGIAKILGERGIYSSINRTGSMLSVHFAPLPVNDFLSASHGDNGTFKRFFHKMIYYGIYIPPSPYEAWFLSDALTFDDLHFTIDAVRKATA